MNKLLLMSAAAVLTTTAGAAFAGTHTPASSGSTAFYSTNGSGGNYCNQWTVKWATTGAYANTDSLGKYCGSTYAGDTSVGVAFAGDTSKKKSSHVFQFPASVATLEGAKSYGSNFVVSGKHLKTGDAYVGWGAHFSGSTISSPYEFSAGKIILGQFDKVSPNALRDNNGKLVPVHALMNKYAQIHSQK